MNGTEIVTGKNSVLEILRSGKRRCHKLWILEGRQESVVTQILDEAQRLKVPHSFLGAKELETLSGTQKHQGVAAKVGIFPYSPLSEIIQLASRPGSAGIILALDNIVDPQNLGALIRTAHLLGVEGVIIPKDRSVGVTPAVLRSSAGATEYLPISIVTNLVSALNTLKDKDFWIVGSAASAAEDLFHFNFTDRRYVIVLGGEGKGMRRLVRDSCDIVLRIPIFGKIESYNVSVAGAIFMAEAVRQRLFFKS